MPLSLSTSNRMYFLTLQEYGEDDLLIEEMSGHEAVSELFEFRLRLLSEHDDIDPRKIIGKWAILRIETWDSRHMAGERHWNGYVSRFAQTGRAPSADGEGDLYTYECDIVPWFWMLTQHEDCRIFQNLSVPEIIDTIFAEFTRLPGPAGDEPGAGLGLAIVRKVASLLAHPLTLSSVHGRGSTFAVAVPRAAPVPATLEPSVPTTRMPLAGLRVLCVDNEPAILEGLSALLKRWGMSVVTAPDAATALAAHGGTETFDAALIDLHLGDGPDGLSVVQALRRTATHPIALITADADETLPARAAASGAVLMAKPVRPAALKAFLSRR